MPRFAHKEAPDIEARLGRIVELLELDHIDAGRIHCRRSWGSTADAYARIWELPSMWRAALDVAPQYVIEVLAEHFDELDAGEQTKVLIHELLHIPKTFSGALRNHRGQGEPIDGRTVNRYYRRYVTAEAHRRAVESGEENGQYLLRFTTE
jgi:predicted metallopeptidase